MTATTSNNPPSSEVNEAMLSLSNISFAYGERQVLQGVNLEIRRGEIIGLLGPNGSGKSTLLAILAGLRERDSGSIERLGVAVEPTTSGYRRNLGVIFQTPSLDTKLTATENLRLSAQLHGLPSDVVAERIAQGLTDAALEERSEEPVEQFSGGMRRRLDLARAMLHHPTLVLADEPTTGLDEAAFQRTWRHLERLRDEHGATIIVTTHRPEEAERCDRLAVLSEGKVLCVDTPDVLRSRVHGDVLAIDAEEPETLRSALGELVSGDIRVEGDRIFVECDKGHELIVRIVEALPAGSLRAIELRRPGLGDAFLKLTGTSLEDE